VVGLTRSLALDEGRHGIRVNAICPGFIATHLVTEWLEAQPDPEVAERRLLEVHPLGRIGTPADIAAFIAFLASDDAAFATGASFLVDGGLSARFAA
jgi:NAD(P)-dependent dehydrogenase (short-subunit alcohol dehydrogenase family)